MTVTKEWLRQQIAEMEAARDDIPFGLNEDGTKTLEALKTLLAGMTSEPVILYRERNPYNGMSTGWIELTQDEFDFIKENAGENAEFKTVYAAPPAPVAVPDVATPETVQALSGVQACFAGGWAYLDESQREIASDVWNACRAAMLNDDGALIDEGTKPLIADEHRQLRDLVMMVKMLCRTVKKYNATSQQAKDYTEYLQREGLISAADCLRDGAAMLKAEPVTADFTETMTPEMIRAVQINSELGAYAAANLAGAYGMFDEFWKVACRAMNKSEPEKEKGE